MEAVEALLARVAVSKAIRRRLASSDLVDPSLAAPSGASKRGPWSFSKAFNLSMRCFLNCVESRCFWSRSRRRVALPSFRSSFRDELPPSTLHAMDANGVAGAGPEGLPPNTFEVAGRQGPVRRAHRAAQPSMLRRPEGSYSVEHAEACLDVGVRGVVHQRVVVVLVARVRRDRSLRGARVRRDRRVGGVRVPAVCSSGSLCTCAVSSCGIDRWLTGCPAMP